MKTIIIILLTFLSVSLISLVLVFSGSASSIIPGWNTVIIPAATKNMLTLAFNFILPIYFMLKLKLLKNWFFLSYFVIVNGLYGYGIWLKNKFNNSLDIDFIGLQALLKQLSLIFIATLVLHIAFYVFLLIRLRKPEKPAK